MTSKNDHTGDKQQSKPPTDNYREGWEAIFGKEKERVLAEKIRLRIACPESGYPYSEALYSDIADYEAKTGNHFK